MNIGYDDYAYQLISRRYGAATTTQSGVPLINHIREGLEVLGWIAASQDARAAFCIHPLLQADHDVSENWDSQELARISPSAIILAVEYRSVANDYLSAQEPRSIEDIRLSPLQGVNQMLVADKVQNFKDFRRYHQGTHPRARQLDLYFRSWLQRLEVGFAQFEDWEARLSGD